MDNTLHYYDAIASDFVQGTVHVNMESLYQLFLKYLPQGAAICDLGCGSGRDSKHFLEKGYTVAAIDGSAELCKIASAYIGREVRNITFDQIDYHEVFDGIWACASLLHVSSLQLPSIFEKIARSLKSGGYLYVSFKYGTFEGERNGRHFTDLTEDGLAGIIRQINDLQIIETAVGNDMREGRQQEKWLNAILKKQ